MPYTLLLGSFVIRYPDLPREGPEPEGDTILFLPDTPALVEGLPRLSGRPPDINLRGVTVRLEAIDALEAQFGQTHQNLIVAHAARDELLRHLGFTNVRFFDDLPNRVEAADQDAVRGHLLSNGIDAHGRLVAWVYPGEHPGPDGAQVRLNEDLLLKSVNVALLDAGWVYPLFHTTLAPLFLAHLEAPSKIARINQLGMWRRSTADPDRPATITDPADLEELIIWPKLFRRVVPYLASGFTDFDSFDAWLRDDPIHRDDELFFLQSPRKRGNLHDVVRGSGQQLQLSVWPEDFAFSPDPPPGGGTGPQQLGVGDVLIVAALPDPTGIAGGGELVTLVNVTASPIELTGWGLVDAAGGRKDLAGPLAAGGVIQVTAKGALELGDEGDRITLLDPRGRSIDQVTYTANRVRPGRTICFGR